MVLPVNKSTSKCMIYYGELGRPPLVIQIKQRMANFWIKLAQGKYPKLSVIMYRLLLNLNNNSKYESPLIKTVQNILYESGLSNFGTFLMSSITNGKNIVLKSDFMTNIFKHCHQMYFTMINLLHI